MRLSKRLPDESNIFVKLNFRGGSF